MRKVQSMSSFHPADTQPMEMDRASQVQQEAGPSRAAGPSSPGQVGDNFNRAPGRSEVRGRTVQSAPSVLMTPNSSTATSRLREREPDAMASTPPRAPQARSQSPQTPPGQGIPQPSMPPPAPRRLQAEAGPSSVARRLDFEPVPGAAGARSPRQAAPMPRSPRTPPNQPIPQRVQPPPAPRRPARPMEMPNVAQPLFRQVNRQLNLQEARPVPPMPNFLPVRLQDMFPDLRPALPWGHHPFPWHMELHPQQGGQHPEPEPSDVSSSTQYR